MAFIKKTWVDRNVQYPGRRKLSAVSGEDSVYDVTRSEGTITDPGDAFNAENMNGLESRIETTTTALETRVTALETKVGNYSLWVGTQTEYNAITTKDANTIYHILES